MRGDGGTMRRYAPLGGWQRIDPDPPVPIGEKLEWAIHEIIFFYLGKATVLLLTVGLVRVKDDDDGVGSWWNRVWRMPDGKLAITESGTSFVGFIVLAAAGLGVVAVLRG